MRLWPLAQRAWGSTAHAASHMSETVRPRCGGRVSAGALHGGVSGDEVLVLLLLGAVFDLFLIFGFVGYEALDFVFIAVAFEYVMHFAAAAKDVAFSARLTELEPELVAQLEKLGVARPLVFANLTRAAPRSAEARTAFEKILAGLSVPPDSRDSWADDLVSLHATARDCSGDVARRTGSLTGFEVSADIMSHRLSRHAKSETRDLHRLSLESLAHLPSEWRGKRYRRTEGRESEHARAEGERTERMEKAREVVGLLVEAHLPYASSLARSSGFEDTTLLRCCRGLRAKTLAQRVSCWRPFRRYLSQGYPAFPSSADQVLEYFKVRGEEGAARTAILSLLASLRFLEEAGELPEADRLSTLPALKNAAKEAAVTTTTQTPAKKKRSRLHLFPSAWCGGSR